MHFLDICDDILLEILVLVDPVDLLNIFNVCKRLRDLAEWTINKVVLKLHLTGIKSFPNLQLRPFDNLDRIQVNSNWLDGKFSRKTFFQDFNFDCDGIILDEYLYAIGNGAIRKYDRLWNGEYLSSEFKLIGNKKHCEINALAKKDNVIFAGYNDGSCRIFQDEILTMERSTSNPIWGLDLFPKHDIYVAATYSSVQIWNKSDETLLTVEKSPLFSRYVKIDPSGAKLLIGSEKCVSLYNFNTKNKEDLVGLDRAKDLVWKDIETFFSGHENGSLRLFDLRTRSVCQRFDSMKNDILISIQFDGQNAVLCGFEESNIVNICDLRINKVLKELHFNDKPPDNFLKQIIADPKHLFVATVGGLEICDFSV